MRHQFDDPVGKRQHPGVMGGDHDHPFPGRQFADQPQHFLDLDVVQVCGRLIGDQEGRVEGDGPGDRHPLLLTAAEISGPVRHPIGQADPGQQFGGPFAGFMPTYAGGPHRHHDVLDRGQAWHQVESLEDDTDGVAPIVRECARVQFGDVDVAELDPSGAGPQNPAKTGQQGRLPAAAGPQQDRQGSRRDVQIEAVDRPHRFLAAGVLDHQVLDS